MLFSEKKIISNQDSGYSFEEGLLNHKLSDLKKKL